MIDLGAGPGVFSLLACQYGAGRVIAIEPDDSVELLRQLAADNACADRITVFQGLSTDFDPPARADVIVSDIRGCLPLFETHVATIIDARERLLAANGRLIPAQDLLRIALVESPKDLAATQEPWCRNDYGLDLAAGDREAEQIVEAAAVDADIDDLAALQQRRQVDRGVGRRFPVLSAGPGIGMQTEPELDVEMLRIPDPEFVLAFLACLGEILDQARNKRRPPGMHLENLSCV